MDILVVENLSKIYESGLEELHVIKDLDLKLEKGKKLIITGESGCGKSTLLNIIGGLDSPSKGNIFVDNYKINEIKEEDLYTYRNRVIGFIFQFHFLLKELTAQENVMLPMFISGKTKKESSEKALELLNRVKLDRRTNHYPSQLSGGERQRVAVARAMINKPKLILADEPTGNLDEENSRVVEELLFSLVEEENASLVLVTHDKKLSEKGDIRMNLEKGKLCLL